MQNTVLFENDEMNRMLGYVIPHIKEEENSFVVFTKNAKMLSESLSEYLENKGYVITYAENIKKIMFNISEKNAVFVDIQDKYSSIDEELFNKHFDALMEALYDYSAGYKGEYDIIINDICSIPRLTHITKYLRLSLYDLSSIDLNVLVTNMDDFEDKYSDTCILYDFDYYIDMTNRIIVNLQVDDIPNTTFRIY